MVVVSIVVVIAGSRGRVVINQSIKTSKNQPTIQLAIAKGSKLNWEHLCLI